MNPWFANPWMLWCGAVLPTLGMIVWWSRRWRRKRLAELGALYGLVHVRRGPRLLRGFAGFVGLLLLIAGTAGPQWDVDDSPEIISVPTRDLVIVLDLSRSMLAELPSRQELAQRGLKDLCETLKKRGGVRVALVAFAGRPKLVFPLTSDYDHLAEALKLQDADNVPRELRPDPDEGDVSGTRIGAALRLAVQAHDPRLHGAQDILLVSDGDDPVNDDEWQQGAGRAHEEKIPVHTIGVGSADADSFLSVPGNVAGGKIATRLREKPLQEIARLTRGVYVPAQTQALPLGQIFQDIVAARLAPSAPAAEAPSTLTIYKQRYTWFLAGALVGLVVVVVVPERGFRRPRVGARGLGLAAIPLALVLVSAAPPDAVEALVRRGNAAFALEKFDEALHLYDQAEESARDPGLVAFNKAACLYRLKHYAQAAQHFRACLEDQRIAPARLVRAWYDLGNCLVQQGPGQPAVLEEALDCYRQCLAHPDTPAELRTDAQHNLEVAKQLWLKARATAKDSTPKTDLKDPEHPSNKKHTKTQSWDPREKTGRPGKEGDPGFDPKGNGQDPGEAAKKLASRGQLFSLPDQDEPISLPRDAAEDFIDRAARRILEERRAWNRPPAGLLERVKDW